MGDSRAGLYRDWDGTEALIVGRVGVATWVGVSYSFLLLETPYVWRGLILDLPGLMVAFGDHKSLGVLTRGFTFGGGLAFKPWGFHFGVCSPPGQVTFLFQD